MCCVSSGPRRRTLRRPHHSGVFRTLEFDATSGRRALGRELKDSCCTGYGVRGGGVAVDTAGTCGVVSTAAVCAALNPLVAEASAPVLTAIKPLVDARRWRAGPKVINLEVTSLYGCCLPRQSW
jgi:hypothetical protein